MASQIPQYYQLEDPPMTTPEHARAGGRYRRDRSPPKDVYQGSGDDMEPRTPNSDMAIQDAMLAHSIHQSRGSLPSQQQEQSPGQRNRYPPQSGASAGSRACPPGSSPHQPPSYSGPSPGDPAFEGPRRRAARHARRLSGASDGGGIPGPGSSRPPMNNGSPARGPEPMNGDREPARRESRSRSQQFPPSPTRGPPVDLNTNSPGRVSSPSINQSVLHPLETKMREYYGHMEEEQKRMRQLDEEIRALEDQRRQAEERFVDAKAKHDEYERQHMDVERALRGDFPPRQHPQQQPPQQAAAPSPSWTMTRAPSMDSFEERERPASGRSGGPNPKGRSRFRMSLFKN